MASVKIPVDIIGLDWVEQVSWAAGDPGSGETALNARNIKFEPQKNVHSPGYQKREACRGPDKAVVGGEGGVLTFELPLRGGAGAESECSKLISNCGFTRYARASGSGKVTNATSSTLVALTADIGAYVVGDAICVSGTGTDTQIRMITRVQDDVPGAGSTTVSVAPNWADTPVSTDSFYACDSFTPTVGEPTKYTTFYLWQGAGATDILKYVLEGCAGTFKILSTDADTLPFVEFTYQVDNWTASEAADTSTADTYNPGHPLLGDTLTIGDTAVLTESFAFDPQIKLSPITATSGTNGRAGWLYHGVEPKLEMAIYHNIDILNTSWASDQDSHLAFESIKDTDEFWGVFIAAAQFVKPNYDALKNEHLGLKPEFVAVDPGMNADSANYPLFVLCISGYGT